MAAFEQHEHRHRRAKVPLDGARLEEMTLAYVARYATTRAKLLRYLQRKLHERGWTDGEPAPDLAALTVRYAELGYVDDAAFARAKSGSLLRRGYGARRVDQALGQDGVDEGIRADVRPGEAETRHAALALAERRRFGPFGPQPPDRDRREKQIAAMLRAGHSLDTVREIVNAISQEAARAWACELDEDEPRDA